MKSKNEKQQLKIKKLTADIVTTELSSVTASSTINLFGFDFVFKMAVARSSLKIKSFHFTEIN